MSQKELKGTKTERNLMEAFAGESQARNKYTYFASKARKDGYEQIAALFEETANNEKEHAKMWFKYLEGGAVKRASTILLPLCVEWQPSRNITRSATVVCCKTLKRASCSRARTTASGSAATADISSLANRRPKCAPYASIRKAILR